MQYRALYLQGRNGAVAVIAVAERGSLFDPGPCMYMEKMAVGPIVNPRAVSLNKSIASNLRAVAEAQGTHPAPATSPPLMAGLLPANHFKHKPCVKGGKRNTSSSCCVPGAPGKAMGDVTVVILDRPRHADIIQQCREAGARIRMISDGDVAAAIEVAKAGAPVDILLGVGGTPEGGLLLSVPQSAA